MEPSYTPAARASRTKKRSAIVFSDRHELVFRDDDGDYNAYVDTGEGTARVFLWREGTWDQYKLTWWVHKSMQGHVTLPSAARLRRMFRVTIPRVSLPRRTSRRA